MSASAGSSTSVEEDLGRRVVHHRLDRPDRERLAATASRMSTRNVERPSVCFVDLVERRRAREQEHQVGVLAPARSRSSGRGRRSRRRRRARRWSAMLRRVGAGRRLGDAEGLQPQLAASDPRQVARASAPRCRAAAACPSMYICAWQAPALPPERVDLLEDRRTPRSRPSPAPPYSSGISAASQPSSVSASTNSLGIAVAARARASTRRGSRRRDRGRPRGSPPPRPARRSPSGAQPLTGGRRGRR